MKTTFLLLMLFVGTAVAPFAASQPSRSTPEALRSAVNAALRNDAAAAEEDLAGAIVSPAGSRGWHLELAVLLMRLVHDVQQEGRCSILNALVSSAAGHLTQAEVLSTTRSEQAQAKALTGLLNERYIGNISAAALSYRAASQLNPNHPFARKSAERLERSEDSLRRRLASKASKP